jgi:hypothetical protein
VPLALAVAALASCSSDSSPSDDGASLGQTLPPTSVTAPEVPEASDPRTGVVVVGGATSPFTLSECRLEEDPSDPEGAGVLVRVSGAGTSAAGVPFQVEAQRFAATGEVDTFTDTVTYTDSAKILQALRFEVAGEVTDPRDPSARAVLLRTRPDGISVTGIAGPPGNVGDDPEGLVGLALTATC